MRSTARFAGRRAGTGCRRRSSASRRCAGCAARRATSTAGGEHRDRREQAVRRHAEDRLAVGREEVQAAGEPEHAEDQDHRRDGERADPLDGEDPGVVAAAVLVRGDGGARSSLDVRRERGRSCMEAPRSRVDARSSARRARPDAVGGVPGGAGSRRACRAVDPHVNAAVRDRPALRVPARGPVPRHGPARPRPPGSWSASSRREPTNEAALEALARAYFGSAQLTRAEDALTRLVQLAPANGWARRALARTLERQSRHDEAVPHHRMADALGARVTSPVLARATRAVTPRRDPLGRPGRDRVRAGHPSAHEHPRTTDGNGRERRPGRGPRWTRHRTARRGRPATPAGAAGPRHAPSAGRGRDAGASRWTRWPRERAAAAPLTLTARAGPRGRGATRGRRRPAGSPPSPPRPSRP